MEAIRSQKAFRVIEKHLEELTDDFQLGRHDCVHWVLQIAGEINDRSYDNFIPPYSKPREGLDILRAKSLRQRLDEAFGKRVAVSRAVPGDILYYKGRLGICIGEYSIFLPGKKIKTLNCSDCWNTR